MVKSQLSKEDFGNQLLKIGNNFGNGYIIYNTNVNVVNGFSLTGEAEHCMKCKT